MTGYSPPVTDDFQLPGPDHPHDAAYDDHGHEDHDAAHDDDHGTW